MTRDWRSHRQVTVERHRATRNRSAFQRSRSIAAARNPVLPRTSATALTGGLAKQRRTAVLQYELGQISIRFAAAASSPVFGVPVGSIRRISASSTAIG